MFVAMPFLASEGCVGNVVSIRRVAALALQHYLVDREKASAAGQFEWVAANAAPVCTDPYGGQANGWRQWAESALLSATSPEEFVHKLCAYPTQPSGHPPRAS